jgi:hypothetical protein
LFVEIGIADVDLGVEAQLRNDAPQALRIQSKETIVCEVEDSAGEEIEQAYYRI